MDAMAQGRFDLCIVNTLQEYLQLAKAKPGALTYASAGPGSITQLLGEWIKQKSGANILDVPYKSVGAEMPDLLGGQITTGYLVATAIMAHVKAGKLRGLAVTGRARLPVIRDVPTCGSGATRCRGQRVERLFCPRRHAATEYSDTESGTGARLQLA